MAIFLAGCSSANSASGKRSTIAEQQGETKILPTAPVSRIQAFKDAEAIASREPGRASAAGAGESMQPVYGENTMLVISKIAYDDLAAGMTVAYINQRGHQVVHQLIAKDTKGWRVQGYNNEAEDRERVTRQNLLGVVYASFTSGVEL